MEYKLKQINLLATKKCIRNSPVDRGEQQQRLALHCTSYFFAAEFKSRFSRLFQKKLWSCFSALWLMSFSFLKKEEDMLSISWPCRRKRNSQSSFLPMMLQWNLSKTNAQRTFKTWSLLPGGLLIQGHLTGNSIPWSWFQWSSRTGGHLVRVIGLTGFTVSSLGPAIHDSVKVHTITVCPHLTITGIKTRRDHSKLENTSMNSSPELLVLWCRTLTLKGTDMLSNTACFASSHRCFAEEVKQRGLAMIDMSHDGDYWWTRTPFRQVLL